MTCPCKYPIVEIDKDIKINMNEIDYLNPDMVTYWGPDDEEQRIPIKIEEVKENGKQYVAVMWKDPGNAKVQSYIVNGHYVYAGCDYDSLVKKGNGMRCEEKELYVVMHPKKEWYKDHIIRR